MKRIPCGRSAHKTSQYLIKHYGIVLACSAVPVGENTVKYEHTCPPKILRKLQASLGMQGWKLEKSWQASQEYTRFSHADGGDICTLLGRHEITHKLLALVTVFGN